MVDDAVIHHPSSLMRIIAGEFKGRRLKAPTWDGLRPTSDRLRETLFNILGDAVRDARVLDGYAGTGALGIEALSRGAAHATFVESDARAARLIADNLAPLTGLAQNRYAIIRADFADAVRRLDGGFDVVLLDPPYADDGVARALDVAARLAASGGRIVIEHAKRYPAPESHAGLSLRRRVVAGDSALAFYGRGE
jgi:16S rRNA (guanine(966)-N(2))-methyltransferase RsmD